MLLLNSTLHMVTNRVFPVFPVPISIYNLGEEYHEMNEQLVEDSFIEKNRHSHGELMSNKGGWHSSFGMEDRYNSFNKLQSIIESCCNDYCKQTHNKSGLEVYQLWTNMNGCGDFNMSHHHGRSALTGVYYPVGDIIQDEYDFNYQDNVTLIPGSGKNGKGGAVVFQDPSYAIKTHLEAVDEISPYNMGHYSFYPVAGVLVIFPSYLIHLVTPFKEDKTRVSISFCCRYGTY